MLQCCCQPWKLACTTEHYLQQQRERLTSKKDSSIDQTLRHACTATCMKAAPWLQICRQAAFGSFRLTALQQGRQLQLKGAGSRFGSPKSGTLMIALHGCLPHHISSYGRPLPPSSYAVTQQLLQCVGCQPCLYSQPSQSASGRCLTMAAQIPSHAAAATDSATEPAVPAGSSNGSGPAVGWHRRTRVQDIKVRQVPVQNPPDSDAISNPRAMQLIASCCCCVAA